VASADSTPSWLESGQPLYLRVARDLEAEITRQGLRPGDRLPGERAICRRFQVSRVTGRRALAHMSAQGLIRPAPGRGWFVTEPVLGEPNALMSLSAMAAEHGLDTSSRVLVAVSRPATVDEADTLTMAPGEAVFDLERVRLLNEIAISLDRSRVPLRVAPDLLEIDFRTASLYRALEHAGATPARADYQLQALPADRREAELLQLVEGEPLLVATATAFDQVGRPVELSRVAYRGDRYRFAATLFRSARASGEQ
jgi:GntR family transcriptional regulator